VELQVVRGDIAEQRVDAVVNAADRRMRGGGGVDGALHAAAGPGLLQECVQRFPHGLRTGEAGWTNGHRLPVRYVIHVVGPNHRAGETDRGLLVCCYANALRVADELEVRSIAFPLVSAGIFGWPREDAVAAAVDTLSSTPTQVRTGVLVAYGEDAYADLTRHLGDAGR
jgi:O-acetyl-ADP-ribose deacetylase